MKDNMTPIKGKFSISLMNDNNEIVDTYEDNNLIVDLSKEKMAQVLGKLATTAYINEIRLGGEGVKVGTIVPKDAGDGFDSTRTQLFAEENSSFTYNIQFTPTGNNGDDAVVDFETDTITGVSSSVNVSSLTNVVKFTITIPKENANNGSVFSYSEAGLYMGGNLFAMKLFPTRIKTSSLKMIINWSIIF